MPSLRAWVHRRLHRDPVKASDLLPDAPRPEYQQPDLPFVPRYQRRCLTPPAASFTSSLSPFFQKLPYDVRHEIYLLAFGNRTIHIDLKSRHLRTEEAHHTRLTAEHDAWESSELKPWWWWSCVCHREQHLSEMLSADKCRLTGHWTGEPRHKYWAPSGSGEFVGVMGWLLSCHQAYIETIDMLFATNTIFIANFVLTSHLTKVFLPQRLASITSLELYWHFSPLRFAGDELPFIDSWQVYKDLMPTISPPTFPKLRRLLIFIDGLGSSSVDFGGDDKTKHHPIPVLHPADEIATMFGGQLKTYNIAYPARLFDAIKKRIDHVEVIHTGTDGPTTFGGSAGRFEQFWRTMKEQEAVQTLAGEGVGYWVRTGMNNRLF